MNETIQTAVVSSGLLESQVAFFLLTCSQDLSVWLSKLGEEDSPAVAQASEWQKVQARTRNSENKATVCIMCL